MSAPRHQPRPVVPCSDAARLRGDSLAGSAGPARRWLLIGHPGPWSPAVQDSASFAGGSGARIWGRANRAGMRILLIRRPGRRRPGADRSLAILDQASGRAWWGGWNDPGDILDVLADPPALRATAPCLLVCTHGRHDTCCAVRGRGVAAALAQAWPESTWECSHLGGDRFAANLLVVPDGALYGGLDPQSAVSTVHRHLSGRTDPDHLRGVSGLSPAAQVAVIEAVRRHRVALSDVVVGAIRSGGAGSWEVDVQVRGTSPSRIVVGVQARATEPALLTCKAFRPSSPTRFEVVAVQEVAAR